MSEVKQVKVDNWGIFFLQRLKHFFNRTDYCDLTLQFQDNAQLKVHRLVLSACTEYFEVLERTCEMYEDCLVMPDDLQADVVVPIVNFMYTGQLEFRMNLLERLYLTSLVMNMPVLTKLLDAHRSQPISREVPSHSYSNPKRFKSYDTSKNFSHTSDNKPSSSQSSGNKRSYGKAQKKQILLEPRPTRYELPEELEGDNIFDNSFTNISYTSKPLMVHPETTKHYPSKRFGIFEDPSTSKRFIHSTSTMDIVECKKISVNDHIFDDDPSENICDEQESYSQPIYNKPESKDQLFDQILDNGGPKVTIETKDSKQASNLDHAKIISEVLKKYPHLVKSNKNIKLKILNTPNRKRARQPNPIEDEKKIKEKTVKAENDYTFETDVIDSKEAAKLIALGAENIKGPWICLICGTPGKAIHFSSYYKFRRHLVEVHKEKPVSNICEYCGQKSMKVNYLLHHLYTKHGIQPPPQYHFPKCNICNYVALSESFLAKHKLTHSEKQTFRCNVCSATFCTSNQLLVHIQKTGHKYSKVNMQCVYCCKVFLRESNLYAHLRTYHKEAAKNDGIIEVSDSENVDTNKKEKVSVKPVKQEVYKYEVPISYKNDYEDADIQYQIQQQPDGNIQVVSKKPKILLPTIKHKILNPGISTPSNVIGHSSQGKTMVVTNNSSKQNEYLHNPNISIDNETDEIVVIDNNEYIVKDNQLMPKKDKSKGSEAYSMPDIMQTNIEESVHNIIPTTTTVEYTNTIQTTDPEDHKMLAKKASSINQPIQIVVSNEEEYKALMASNHSIIFEDGDAGKTLTVLTAPHDNTATIDLDNTQTNDMMIIQDDYPLNVSEAVSGDNSNIVVVYSHPVHDQNKEYQLITSDNIGAQFVTSSGIITQSYETVTTSAPVMNANILETHVDDSWQNSIPHNIEPAIEMEIPISSHQLSIAPLESQQSSIDNISNMQLASDNSKALEIHSTAEQVNNQTISTTVQSDLSDHDKTSTVVINDVQPDVTITSKAQIVFENTIDSIPTSNTNETNHIVEQESSDQPDEVLNNDSQKVLEDNVNVENTLTAHKAVDESSEHGLINNEIPKLEGSAKSEALENNSEDISVPVPITVPVNMEVQTFAVIETTNNREVSLTKAKEQIENLTSEWSDDEMDCSETAQNSIQENRLKNDTECETMEPPMQPQIEPEGTIENIQQEIEKQLAHPIQEVSALHNVVPMTLTDDPTSVMEDDSQIENSQESEPVNKTVIDNDSNKTPVKISSLLNDWEDNDSQDDEVPPIVENKENDNFVEESISLEECAQNSNSMDIDPCISKQNMETDPKPTESIKSLVSDWIEDDEDEEAQK